MQEIELNWYFDSLHTNSIAMIEDSPIGDFSLVLTYNKRKESVYAECYFESFPIEKYQDIGRGIIVEQVMDALDTWYPDDFVLQDNKIIAVLKSPIDIDSEMSEEDIMTAIAYSDEVQIMHYEFLILHEVFKKIFFEGANPEELIQLAAQQSMGNV